jgi:hypothetical protein
LPGDQSTFEGGDTKLVITVLDETRTVDCVQTRIVEEREWEKGELEEVSRNFFALSKRTNSVYYFGEEVDIYEDGSSRATRRVDVGREGSALRPHDAGRAAARRPLLPGAGAGRGHGPRGDRGAGRDADDARGHVQQLPEGGGDDAARAEGREAKIYAPASG